MDGNLIDNMEIPEPTFGAPQRNTYQTNSISPSSNSFQPPVHISSSPSINSNRSQSISSHEEHISAISPAQETDLEQGIRQYTYRKQDMSTAAYYARIYNQNEREETIKCFVSSMIFVGIVVVLIVFMFTVNPEM